MLRIPTGVWWSLVLGIVVSGACTPPPVNQTTFAEAVAHQKRGDSERARQAYDRMLKENNRADGLENNRAVLDLADGNWAEALRRLTKELREKPALESTGVNHLYALFLSNGRRQDALVAARRIQPESNASHTAKLAAGIVLSTSDPDWGQAAALLTSLTQGVPSSVRAHAHFALGLGLAKRGKMTEAAAQFHATALLVRNASAHYNRAVILAGTDKTADALNEIRIAVSMEPKSARARHLLAILHARLGAWVLADEATKASIDLAPDRPGLHLLAGRIQAQFGRWDQAVFAFRQEVRISPDSKEAWFNLGIVHCELGAWAQAGTAFQKVLSLDPGNREAANNLAIVQELVGGQ